MGMFKVAVSSGVKTAKAYAPSDDFTSDKQMDLALALGMVHPGLGLPALIANGAVAPSDKYFSTPLRGWGRGVLEGVGGLLAGGAAGGLLGAPSGRSTELGAILGLVGGGLGATHGAYASRRNVREETGDYSTLGGRRDPDRQAVPKGG